LPSRLPSPARPSPPPAHGVAACGSEGAGSARRVACLQSEADVIDKVGVAQGVLVLWGRAWGQQSKEEQKRPARSIQKRLWRRRFIQRNRLARHQVAPVSLYGVRVGEGAGIASADRLTQQTAARVTPRQERKAQRRHLRRRAGGRSTSRKRRDQRPGAPAENRGQVLPGRARSASLSIYRF
jgi:hypothetical protein